MYAYVHECRRLKQNISFVTPNRACSYNYVFDCSDNYLSSSILDINHILLKVYAIIYVYIDEFGR